MDKNFRCPAGPLTLANEVISHNKKRQSKRLHLTRGFGGATTLTFSRTEPEMVATLVGKIERLHQSGVSLAEMAVLVRLNAQTTLLEQALISRQIPYRNANPFYEWPEIQTRMQYGRFGVNSNPLSAINDGNRYEHRTCRSLAFGGASESDPHVIFFYACFVCLTSPTESFQPWEYVKIASVWKMRQ